MVLKHRQEQGLLRRDQRGQLRQREARFDPQLVHGTGPAVMLVHGFPLDGHS
ncbi:MAG: hypothetical protein LH475_12780 [Cryobacterium sp.]|uniref:hypothetical protein n=1 Tax=unclassified Cryobacterium TaxID=2649013 RepID=UPI0018C8FDB9|nr:MULTISPECIES: hypothetical protein [unclassified Cryobacterium]MCY7405477.1 hypothetical protein [Cryobacterium sp.]